MGQVILNRRRLVTKKLENFRGLVKIAQLARRREAYHSMLAVHLTEE